MNTLSPEGPRVGRILVVDDEASNRLLLEAILTAEGHEVVLAASGDEALARIAEGAIDVVLLDVLMPGMDGFEVCRRVRADPEHQTLPVVMITASGNREARIRGKALGADDFLTKPVDDLELLARTGNLLRTKAWHDHQAREHALLAQRYDAAQRHLVDAERHATVGTLAAGVAHELATVSAILVPTIDMIRERAAEGLPPSPGELELLTLASGHLVRHTRRLRSLGAREAEAPERMSAAALTNGVVRGLRVANRLPGIGVQVSLPDGELTVVAQRVYVEQVLVNLIANAADAIALCPEDPRGSARTVRVRWWRPEGEATTRVCCEVADDGPGIAPEVLPRVFEPWFTTKGAARGTGLGLSVARTLVAEHGGTLRVTSVPGVGASFSFDLPTVPD